MPPFLRTIREKVGHNLLVLPEELASLNLSSIGRTLLDARHSSFQGHPRAYETV